jgi:hypothetical protein
MKKPITFVLRIACCMAACASPLFAQLSIPSDGSDGALVISNNTVINLSQAVSGVWTNNNTANAGKGVYDQDKWAVVFKYSSVVISNGATLTFSNHLTHAPIVWLVSGDVTINGTLSLDGKNGVGDMVNLTEPGPGGFRGGAESFGTYGSGPGYGPGGGYTSSGYYSSVHPYGNPEINPLIGGSGSSGSSANGAGGGGAILMAASGTIALNGSCHANGGVNGSGFMGSGGGIRLVANQILGNGTVQATGSDSGRIRVEATTMSPNLVLNPVTIAVPPSNPVTIWPATNAPTVQVTSISNLVANLTAPTDPKAVMLPSGDDLTIATTNAVTIVLQTSNFPTNGTVNVYIKPRNASQSVLPATFVTGSSNSATWKLLTPFPWPVNHTVIQARAVVP